jgi:hypothetical protein
LSVYTYKYVREHCRVSSLLTHRDSSARLLEVSSTPSLLTRRARSVATLEPTPSLLAALRPPCVRCCRRSVADVFDSLSESAHSGALDGRSRTAVVAGVLAAASGRPPLRSKGPFGATVAATVAGHWPFPHNHPSSDPTRAYCPLLPPKLYSGLCTEACVFAQAA